MERSPLLDDTGPIRTVRSTVVSSETVVRIPSLVRESEDMVIRIGIHEDSDGVAKTPKERRTIFETYGSCPSEFKSLLRSKLSLCIYSYDSHFRFNRRNWTDSVSQTFDLKR